MKLSSFLLVIICAMMPFVGCQNTTPTSDSAPLPPLTTKMTLTISHLPVLNDSAVLTLDTYLYDVDNYTDSLFGHEIPITSFITFSDSIHSPCGLPDTTADCFTFLGDSVWVDYMKEGEHRVHATKVKAVKTGRWIIYGAGGLHPDTLFNRTGSPSGFTYHDTLFINVGVDVSSYWVWH